MDICLGGPAYADPSGDGSGHDAAATWLDRLWLRLDERKPSSPGALYVPALPRARRLWRGLPATGGGSQSVSPPAQRAADEVETRFAQRVAPARRRMFLVAAAVIGDRSEAEDVVQDATITAMAKYKAGEFAEGSNFEAWVCQVTRYTALNALRSRTRAAAHLGAAAELRARPAGMPRSAGPDAQDHERLGGALAELGETARLCLLLRIVGGLSYNAIAQVAEVPEGTAMSHVHRSQRALRAALLKAVGGERAVPLSPEGAP